TALTKPFPRPSVFRLRKVPYPSTFETKDAWGVEARGAGRSSPCNRGHNSTDFRHATPIRRRPPERGPCAATLARTATCPEFLCSALRAGADHEGLVGVFRDLPPEIPVVS